MNPYTVPRYLRQAEAPAFGDLAWQDDVPCRQVDPEMFFPGRGEAAEPANVICRSCISRLHCLRYALENPSEGVWGGFPEPARRRIAREHEAGRPLEDIIAADDARHYVRIERGTYDQRNRAAERRNRRLRREALGAATITHPARKAAA